MTQDEERYFEAYFDLFASQGWKQFIEDMDGLEESINDLASINDAENFHLRKGQLQIVRRILGFESAIKTAYQDQKEYD
jgi:heme oxygenase